MNSGEVIKFDKLTPKRKTLIAMVGLPYSGKSMAAMTMFHGAPVVNPDSIRVAIHGHKFIASAEPYVWATAKTMVRALFMAGSNLVVFDATNITEDRRNGLRSDEEWETSFYVVDTPVEVCLERAKEAGDEAIIPIILDMEKRLTFPPKECRW